MVVLAIIAGLVFYCLRAKDKKQKVKAWEDEDGTAPTANNKNKGDIPMKGEGSLYYGIPVLIATHACELKRKADHVSWRNAY